MVNTKALYNLTYGVYLLSAREGERDNACIINTAVQVANNPARVSIAVIKGGFTHDMISRTRVCALSAISNDAEFSLFSHFGMKSGRDEDKFASFVDTARAENGCLYLTKWANAYISLRITDSFDLGSHTLFIGEVTDGEVTSSLPPCTYGYYQTNIKPASKPESTDKKAWRCTICGYVYEGESVPKDYLCPLCKHGVEYFEEVAKVKKYKCEVCGYIHEGELTPDFTCPICKVPSSKFKETE